MHENGQKHQPLLISQDRHQKPVVEQVALAGSGGDMMHEARHAAPPASRSASRCWIESRTHDFHGNMGS